VVKAMGRPREHDEQTRQRLLAAAGRILAVEGSAALSVRRLAAEVGTTTRALYSLFGSKQGLVRALCYDGFAALDRRIAAAAASDDPAADVTAMVAAYRACALERPDLYQVMFGGALPFEPTPAEQAFSLRPLDRLRATVTRGVATGAFHGRDPDRLTMQIWALAHGLASLELRGALPAGDAADACWNEATAALLAGYQQADVAAPGDEGVPAGGRR
jgi:AcrR family transcriptional regulator